MEQDERLFIEGAKRRVEQLIRQKVWQGIDQARFRSWFEQFESRDCELLGACLLDNLIFRSREQVESLIKAAMTSSELIGPKAQTDDEIVVALRGRKDPHVRLSPVIRLDQPPTKSGPYILRRLAKSLHLNEGWMSWPQRLCDEPVSVNMIILVDDFCGTGEQFSEFVKKTGFLEFMNSRSDCRIAYVTVAAHEKGMARIKELYPKIEIIAGEVLNNEHHFFDGNVIKRIKVDLVNERLKTDYDKIAREVDLGGRRIGPMGFDGQALSYAFEHGTPNNTLPIYWYQNEQWSSLVDR
ncbi:phosphoribosyltransferase-like protein [Acidithiobacillus sp. AC3]